MGDQKHDRFAEILDFQANCGRFRMNSSGRKIGIALPLQLTVNAHTDFNGYCRTLAQLGHSPAMICCSSDYQKAAFPIVEATLNQMADFHFWKDLHLDAVIFFNWLRYSWIVKAMKQAGLFVMSRGDTDGYASARVFRQAAWLALEDPNDSPLTWLRKRRYWAQRHLTLSAAEDEDLINTIDYSDAAVIECDEAAKNLCRIFAYYKRPDLERKLHVTPHSVSDDILLHPLPGSQKPRTILCGGRWDDPQKDVHLLTAALDRLLKQHPDLPVVIIGDGAANLLEPLARRCSSVGWLRAVPHANVPKLLLDCRVLVSSSRWEGYSILASEALCMGCTLAAPPLPSFVSMAENGRFGTVSTGRNAVSLADAIERELELWDRGSRNPAEIAAVWRGRVSNKAVVSDLISLIK
jgi:glycosyltransferase involved in cell wall biosynthesis